jgi:hypothetical protein
MARSASGVFHDAAEKLDGDEVDGDDEAGREGGDEVVSREGANGVRAGGVEKDSAQAGAGTDVVREGEYDSSNVF